MDGVRFGVTLRELAALRDRGLLGLVTALHLAVRRVHPPGLVFDRGGVNASRRVVHLWFLLVWKWGQAALGCCVPVTSAGAAACGVAVVVAGVPVGSGSTGTACISFAAARLLASASFSFSTGLRYQSIRRMQLRTRLSAA